MKNIGMAFLCVFGAVGLMTMIVCGLICISPFLLVVYAIQQFGAWYDGVSWERTEEIIEAKHWASTTRNWPAFYRAYPEYA